MGNKGFTMTELLVVVIIMSTLTAIMLPAYRRVVDRSKAAEAMQVLPALFEARERWVIENGCQWHNGGLRNCENSAVLRASKLDTQIPGDPTDNLANNNGSIDDIKIETDNFVYYLVVPGGGTMNQPCVMAAPLWGADLGLKESTAGANDGAKIYYRGDKLSCADGTTKPGGCAILNVDDGAGTGSCH